MFANDCCDLIARPAAPGPAVARADLNCVEVLLVEDEAQTCETAAGRCHRERHSAGRAKTDTRC
jgi:uncharacterized ParB-like nuclease family protein